MPTLSSIPGLIGIGAKWKTYTNSEWQITFNYPAQWEVVPFGTDLKHPTYIELQIKKFPYIGVLYTANPKNLTLEQIDQENAKKDKQRGTGIDTPRIAPFNHTAVTTKSGYKVYYEKKYFCEPAICERYTFVNPNKVIQIIVFSRKDINDFPKIIDQILSTFKFTQ